MRELSSGVGSASQVHKLWAILVLNVETMNIVSDYMTECWQTSYPPPPELITFHGMFCTNLTNSLGLKSGARPFAPLKAILMSLIFVNKTKDT